MLDDSLDASSSPRRPRDTPPTPPPPPAPDHQAPEPEPASKAAADDLERALALMEQKERAATAIIRAHLESLEEAGSPDMQRTAFIRLLVDHLISFVARGQPATPLISLLIRYEAHYHAG